MVECILVSAANRHFRCSGDIVSMYKQWKKIRDRYVREKRKLRMSANGEQDVPGWELFQALSWIDPHLDERAA